MDVQCEQRGCGETVDMRETKYCNHCHKQVCADCYSEFHEEHDEQDLEPKWAQRLLRQER